MKEKLQEVLNKVSNLTLNAEKLYNIIEWELSTLTEIQDQLDEIYNETSDKIAELEDLSSFVKDVIEGTVQIGFDLENASTLCETMTLKEKTDATT